MASALVESRLRGLCEAEEHEAVLTACNELLSTSDLSAGDEQAVKRAQCVAQLHLDQPVSADVPLYQAYSLYQAKKNQESLTTLTRALNSDASSDWTDNEKVISQYLLSQLHYRMHQYNESMDQLSGAISQKSVSEEEEKNHSLDPIDDAAGDVELAANITAVLIGMGRARDTLNQLSVQSENELTGVKYRSIPDSFRSDVDFMSNVYLGRVFAEGASSALMEELEGCIELCRNSLQNDEDFSAAEIESELLVLQLTKAFCLWQISDDIAPVFELLSTLQSQSESNDLNSKLLALNLAVCSDFEDASDFADLAKLCESLKNDDSSDNWENLGRLRRKGPTKDGSYHFSESQLTVLQNHLSCLVAMEKKDVAKKLLSSVKKSLCISDWLSLMAAVASKSGNLSNALGLINATLKKEKKGSSNLTDRDFYSLLLLKAQILNAQKEPLKAVQTLRDERIKCFKGVICTALQLCLNHNLKQEAILIVKDCLLHFESESEPDQSFIAELRWHQACLQPSLKPASKSLAVSNCDVILQSRKVLIAVANENLDQAQKLVSKLEDRKEDSGVVSTPDETSLSPADLLTSIPFVDATSAGKSTQSGDVSGGAASSSAAEFDLRSSSAAASSSAGSATAPTSSGKSSGKRGGKSGGKKKPDYTSGSQGGRVDDENLRIFDKETDKAKKRFNAKKLPSHIKSRRRRF